MSIDLFLRAPFGHIVRLMLSDTRFRLRPAAI